MDARRMAKLAFWKICFPREIKLNPPTIDIVSGPFHGLHYTDRAQGSYISPKVLGTYEMELHPVISSIQAHPWDTLIDIGAAEGYYAVGLAATTSVGHVIAFEEKEAGRKLLREIAHSNAVPSPIEVRERCEPEDLRCVLRSSGRTVIICDVEGYEATLLDPELIGELHDSSILVELHEFLCHGVARLLRERFNESHSIDVITGKRRRGADFPKFNVISRCLPQQMVVKSMNEGRKELQDWYWMQPRTAA